MDSWPAPRSEAGLRETFQVDCAKHASGKFEALSIKGTPCLISDFYFLIPIFHSHDSHTTSK
jgi:hypothetical protein